LEQTPTPFYVPCLVRDDNIGGFREEIQSGASLHLWRISHMNRPGLVRFAASFVLALLTASSGWAQQISATAVNATPVPHLVSYGGTLKDGNGKPVTGITGVTFLLYRDAEGGAPLWMETQNVMPDSAGRYTAQLGATRSEGLPPETFMTGEARWLAVQVTGAPEQPRVLLVAVPYAMKAADAETIGGLPPSAFVLAASPSGATRSGAAGPSVDAATSNPVPGAPPPASTVTTSGGTVNALPLWTTATNVQSSAITQTGSGATAKIGIGTTTPSAALDVKGSEYVRGTLTLPPAGNATATAGKNSQPQNFIASSFNSVISTGVNQKFQWQAEPAANDTANPSGTLNLLYGLGATTPAETGLKLSNKGIFTFATGQTFPGTGPGTITGVSTASGSGLMGGGTSGNLNVALTNTCASKQTLVWNGSSWACGTVGTVTSVGLTAPASDFTVSGSPVTASGNLGLNWNIAPTSANTANAIVKRDANGSINASVINASNIDSAGAIVATDTIGERGVYATSTSGTGVYGWGGTYGVSGLGNQYGVYGQSSGTDANADGVHGKTNSATASGVAGVNDEGTGVYGVGGNGVIGSSGVAGGVGVGAYNSSNGDALFAENQSGGFAAFFLGDVDVDGTLSKAGGAFKIDHPLDPSEKYLYHSFVESPDMMNIYNGNVTTDAQGDAIVTMPDWFEALNRDFRYQLTVIGTFAQAIVLTEMANGSFSIKTDKPNVKVSWQVTGVRQDAWANAHRIPVEQLKPENERGSYLHPELFGAPEEKSIAWARHPETMKRARERQPLPAPPSLPAPAKH
jgi:trimeric autotransporter adhesin